MGERLPLLARARGLLASEVIGPTVRTQARLITSCSVGICMQAKPTLSVAGAALHCVALQAVLAV